MANSKRPFDVTWDDVRHVPQKRKWILIFVLAGVFVAVILFLKYFHSGDQNKERKTQENIVKSVNYIKPKNHLSPPSLCSWLISLDSTTSLRLGEKTKTRCK